MRSTQGIARAWTGARSTPVQGLLLDRKADLWLSEFASVWSVRKVRAWLGRFIVFAAALMRLAATHCRLRLPPGLDGGEGPPGTYGETYFMRLVLCPAEGLIYLSSHAALLDRALQPRDHTWGGRSASKQPYLDCDPRRAAALSAAVPAHVLPCTLRGRIASAWPRLGLTTNVTLFRSECFGCCSYDLRGASRRRCAGIVGTARAPAAPGSGAGGEAHLSSS